MKLGSWKGVPSCLGFAQGNAWHTPIDSDPDQTQLLLHCCRRLWPFPLRSVPFASALFDLAVSFLMRVSCAGKF